ncbi:MAG: hypothetical protein ACRDGM_09920 [bacterium]
MIECFGSWERHWSRTDRRLYVLAAICRPCYRTITMAIDAVALDQAAFDLVAFYYEEMTSKLALACTC